MTVVLTNQGYKAWPLAGAYSGGTAMPRRMSIDLLGLNRIASYDSLYRTQPWVYTVVNKLARGIGRLPLEAFEQGTPPNPIPDSALQALTRAPYPRARAGLLKEHITGSVALYGNAILVKDRPGPGQPPQALWPVPWRYVGVEAGDREPIGAYTIEIGSVRRRLLPDDVIHFMWWSPDGLGIAPLEALRVTLALEDAAQRYSVGSFANGARPSGAVRTEKALNPKDREQLRAEIEAVHGGVDNAFRIALLTHGMEWQPFSHNAQEAELINLRKLTREEVCAAFDIPPPAIHILDRATFSNIDEQHRMLYQDTYGPWIVMEEETFQAQLIDNERTFAGESLRYKLDEVMRGDFEKRAVAMQRRFQSAESTPNELRAEEGKKPIGDPADADNPANQVYVPVNMVPISMAGQTAAATPADAQAASILAAIEDLKASLPAFNGNGAH